jgi:hypothetical protein
MNTIIEEAEQYEFTNGKYGFIAGAKWQQEQDKKLYSEEIIDILDNVRYWETCSDEYKVIIEKFIEQLNK